MIARPAKPPAEVTLRRGRPRDVADLLALEAAAFTTDRLSRRSFRSFLASPRASLIVADQSGSLAGYVLVLYPARSTLARLYSIPVADHVGRRGIRKLLLAAAERAARRRGRQTMRLEVHEQNARAIARYQKSGYRLFGRHLNYYDDRGHALRFDKALAPEPRRPPAVAGGRPDSAKRIGFDSGHRGRRGRHSFRARL